MAKEQTEGVGGLEHVGIVVPNLEKAIDYYSKALGIKQFRIFESHRKPGSPESKGPPTRTKVGIGQLGNFTFELMEVVEGKHLFKDLLETRGEGVHLAFVVANMEQELARVRAQDMRVIYTGIGTLSDGGSSALLGSKEPGGMLIQLLQVKKSLIERVVADSKEIK